MNITHPYLMFLGDVHDNLAAKTAFGIVDWRRDWCVGQLRLSGCQADLGLPDLPIEQAIARGAKTMVIGVVNPGGALPEHWIDTIVAGIAAGLDIASGLHQKLTEIPAIAAAAKAHGRQLFDVRHSTQKFSTAKGAPRSGRRILTIGTDCSVGKKYTALALERDMRGAGLNADFCATGQTGVLIAGRGISIDAVIADFIAGAAEWLTPANDPDHWDVVEGQGSLFHPSFAGVTLGLLHGSQPDAFVVCHEPTRKTMRNVETPIASIDDVIALTLRHGRLVNPQIRCVGLSINTAALDDAAAKTYLTEVEEIYGVPASDPVRYGTGRIVDRLQREFPA